jgi:hypothetical protein
MSPLRAFLASKARQGAINWGRRLELVDVNSQFRQLPGEIGIVGVNAMLRQIGPYPD